MKNFNEFLNESSSINPTHICVKDHFFGGILPDTHVFWQKKVGYSYSTYWGKTTSEADKNHEIEVIQNGSTTPKLHRLNYIRTYSKSNKEKAPKYEVGTSINIEKGTLVEYDENTHRIYLIQEITNKKIATTGDLSKTTDFKKLTPTEKASIKFNI